MSETKDPINDESTNSSAIVTSLDRLSNLLERFIVATAQTQAKNEEHFEAILNRVSEGYASPTTLNLAEQGHNGRRRLEDEGNRSPTDPDPLSQFTPPGGPQGRRSEEFYIPPTQNVDRAGSKTSRRQSMLEFDEPPTLNLADQGRIVTTTETPRPAPLSSLHFQKVLTWYEAWRVWFHQNSHRRDILLNMEVSEEIKLELLGRNPNIGSDIIHFNQVSNEVLLYLLQKEFKPTSPKEFIRILTTALKQTWTLNERATLPSAYDATKYELLNTDIMRYLMVFRKLHAHLVQATEPINRPGFMRHEKGRMQAQRDQEHQDTIFNIFRSHCPHRPLLQITLDQMYRVKYAQRELDKGEVLEYRKAEDFFSDMQSCLNRALEIYQDAGTQEMSKALMQMRMDALESEKKHYDRNHHGETKDWRKYPREPKEHSKGPAQTPRMVATIDHQTESEYSDETRLSSDEEQQLAAMGAVVSRDRGYAGRSSELKTEPKKAPKETLICYMLTLYGNCTRTNCTFVHDRSIIQAARVKMAANLEVLKKDPQATVPYLSLAHMLDDVTPKKLYLVDAEDEATAEEEEA